MPFSLLYASRSLVPPDDAEAAVEALVAVSRPRNAAVGVTGCLIFGGGRFAQILEGRQTAVED
ncbi:blue light sensor protein, partial [Xanthomonas citri pv. citri]|nr:blue light sensor protein [Xanthomonas citri pv. citri]